MVGYASLIPVEWVGVVRSGGRFGESVGAGVGGVWLVYTVQYNTVGE